MIQRCPTCGRPIGSLPSRNNREEIQQRIEVVRQTIERLENGLGDIVATQPSAPSCTICEQAPPGKKQGPSTTVERVEALRRELADLQRELSAA